MIMRTFTRAVCMLLAAFTLHNVELIAQLSTTLPPAEDGAPDAYRPGGGFNLVRSEMGEVNFKLYTYVRYLNQFGLDDQYVNAFGDTSMIDQRNDILLNKMNIQFMGWLADKRFRYLAYVWTNNTAQGLGAQVVVGGNLTFKAHDAVTFGAGINALPGTRSTEGNFPYWNSEDNRMIIEEFFRPSYTMGIWAKGSPLRGIDYQVMLGNNLSQLGIDAGQLDGQLSTLSMSLGWMPTTGEYGKPDSYGDFEPHEKVATRFGAHYTSSDEDRQSQPGVQSPENVQLRLSDGSILFRPGLLGDSVIVEKARYNMVSFDAGFKYKGFGLDAAYYQRRVDRLRGNAIENASAKVFNDDGFQVQASAMVLPKFLQVYAGYGQINGEYGDPWEWRAGINWFPNRSWLFRWNLEYIRTERSPVGALSLPYTVGGTGGILNMNFMVNL